MKRTSCCARASKAPRYAPTQRAPRMMTLILFRPPIECSSIAAHNESKLIALEERICALLEQQTATVAAAKQHVWKIAAPDQLGRPKLIVECPEERPDIRVG